MKLKLTLIFTLLLIATTILSQNTKLLSFGWDYPDVDQLQNNLFSRQQMPFEGICFSIQRDPLEAFDTLIKPESYFKYDELQKIKWGKYTDNYVFIRGMSFNGPNWLSSASWAGITKNMNRLSKALKIGKVKGILFDPEYYYQDQNKNPWTYSKTQYPDYSFEQMQDIVRSRGMQFINALQQEKTDLSILSIWLSSLIIDETKFMTLEKSRHALLISFMEGVLLAKGKNVKLIDGNESAYWYSKPSQFLESAANLQKNAAELFRSAKAKKLASELQIAQPVFYDGIVVTSKEYEKGFKNLPKWNWLQENLKYAMATSNSNTVWFYNERLNWQNKLNDTLMKIFENSQIHFSAIQKGPVNKIDNILTRRKDNVNTGVGNYYVGFGQNPMETKGIAFNYTFNYKTKILTIRFIDIIPQSVSVYFNNKMVALINPKKLQTKIGLSVVKKGILAILSKYPDGTESCALQTW